MGRFRLDDDFPDWPEIVEAGPLAAWVHVCGLAYCSRHLTDGYIPVGVAVRLVDFTHIGVATGGVRGLFDVGEDVDCEWAIQRLLDVGLWEAAEGGYVIRDWRNHMASSDEVLAGRRNNRARQKRHRKSRTPGNGVTPEVSHAVTDSKKTREGNDPGP